MLYKTCPKCQQNKPIDEFHRDKKMKDGRRTRCKECESAIKREKYKTDPTGRKASAQKWYSNNREKAVAHKREYRQTNPEKEKASKQRWYQAHKEKVAAGRRYKYRKNRDKIVLRNKKWAQANRGRMKAWIDTWRKTHPEKIADYNKKYGSRYPDKVKAREAVRQAVRSGRLPLVTTLICSRCGERQAQHYHHHKGYAKEHWLDVVPVCTSCHEIVDQMV